MQVELPLQERLEDQEVVSTDLYGDEVGVVMGAQVADGKRKLGAAVLRMEWEGASVVLASICLAACR